MEKESQQELPTWDTGLTSSSPGERYLMSASSTWSTSMALAYTRSLPCIIADSLAAAARVGDEAWLSLMDWPFSFFPVFLRILIFGNEGQE